ncbi:hypothetical protein LC55x_2268 [Lysobacter capsici]|uniref:hypothetical protein n=1 Tax=Lysobacter capsici TaxID=435897 RepID=UPI000716789F|nr:hypothetical protein [Lysobacter capsici]ALN85536.1 hypothetical protein LC55x_2268 [Lysobacter capsici]
MSTIKAFLEAAKSLVTLGAGANAAARQQIREVTGQLADELDRALSLADSYLVGVRFSRDDHELAAYLYDARSKLMGSYHEHHICAGLYQLADKFGQLFDPTRFSVSLDSYSEIPQLIEHLKNGERAVIDDLDELIGQFQDLAARLDAAPAGQKDDARAAILASADYFRDKLVQQRKQLKSSRRRIVDTL